MAEEDALLRGAGDDMGARQSGRAAGPAGLSARTRDVSGELAPVDSVMRDERLLDAARAARTLSALCPLYGRSMAAQRPLPV